MGGERRGRDESKHHQRDRVTFLRAQGSLIRGGSHRRRRERHRRERTEQKKKKGQRDLLFCEEKSDYTAASAGSKTRCLNRDAQSEQNNFKMKGRRGLCNT